MKIQLERYLTLFMIVLTGTSAVTPLAGNMTRTAPAPALKAYKIVPNSGQPGITYDVIISSNDSAGCKAKPELNKATLVAPQGSLIEVVHSKHQTECSFSAQIKISADAAIGEIGLWVVLNAGKANETLVGTAAFNVTAPGPPGAKVDIMWDVIPEKITKHNFGGAIAKNYYAIEVVIGNNSGYDLQIASVAFELPNDETLLALRCRNLSNKGGGVDLQINRSDSCGQKRLTEYTSALDRTALPTSSYRITRGTLERGEIRNARTFILGAVTIAGPLLTGFVPFFHNVNHRANFSEGINILSNPVEKGLEALWTDPKPRQRDRFDDQVLRDSLIIHNNTQIRTLAFFPKELLRLPKDFENDSEYDRWKNNAREVRERLGKLIIIGDEISYRNRISITANPPTPVPIPSPTPTVAPTVAPAAATPEPSPSAEPSPSPSPTPVDN